MIAREVLTGLVPEIGLAPEVAEKDHRPTPDTMKNMRKSAMNGW